MIRTEADESKTGADNLKRYEHYKDSESGHQQVLISVDWVNDFCRRGNIKMRKANSPREKKHCPEELELTKKGFVMRLAYLVHKFNIPPELVCNLDETAVKLLTVPSKGRAEAGANADVSWFGADDKRQFTAVPVVFADGKLLMPTQLIWASDVKWNNNGGEPLVKFPGACPSLAVREKHKGMIANDFSKTHWTDFSSFQRLMTSIHTKMVARMKELNLDVSQQKYIIILDVYSVHRSEETLSWWRASSMGKQGLLIYVPANYTGQLQPLDISFNNPFKAVLRREMMLWFSTVIQNQFDAGVCASAITLKSELQLQNLKEPFCDALAKALAYFVGQKGVGHIVRGFKEAGILECWGAGKEALYREATQAAADGKLFPGGKNTAILALLDLGDARATAPTAAEVPADTAEELDATVAAMFELLGSVGGDMIVEEFV